jgi:hypothetical protein
MKNIINIIEQAPKWYGVGIILMYSFLFAEFFSTINNLLPIDNRLGDLLSIILKINYWGTVISSVIVWIILSFLYCLMALLFNGHSSFGRFLFVAAYPYIIPAIMTLVGLLIVDNIQTSDAENMMDIIMNNQSFKLAMNLINYSFIPYYMLIAIIIHYIYEIKYLYAALSVAIPITSIWLITQLFKLIS